MAHKVRLLFRTSEVFYSIQGEGPYTGHPMVFVRLFGCNFTCKGFSNPEQTPVDDTGSDTGVLPTIGCDSIYSWHPSYKGQTTTLTASGLVEAILETLPNHEMVLQTGMKPILCFTGGEPLLHQKAIGEFLVQLADQKFGEFDVDQILFETNCAVPLSEQFKEQLEIWLMRNPKNRLIWANSPKLSNSGEPKSKAIVPKNYKDQRVRMTPRIHQYLKFVSDGSVQSFQEIHAAVEAYSNEILFESPSIHPKDVYVMPEGHTTQQQELIQRLVAEHCMNTGYTFCGRLHCWVFANEKGT